MAADHEIFLSVLSGELCEATLFEPFISRYHAETLIWRRGEALWDTPEDICLTLLSLAERTGSDVVPLDLRGGTVEVLERMLFAGRGIADSGRRFVIMSDDPALLCEAERSPLVCALGSFGGAAGTVLPRIALDGTMEEAIASGALGWLAEDNCEHYIDAACGRITICGGLGAGLLSATGPATIRARVKALIGRPRYIAGSGGCVGEYLGLISMLGAVRR